VWRGAGIPAGTWARGGACRAGDMPLMLACAHCGVGHRWQTAAPLKAQAWRKITSRVRRGASWRRARDQYRTVTPALPAYRAASASCCWAGVGALALLSACFGTEGGRQGRHSVNWWHEGLPSLCCCNSSLPASASPHNRCAAASTPSAISACSRARGVKRQMGAGRPLFCLPHTRHSLLRALGVFRGGCALCCCSTALSCTLSAGRCSAGSSST